MQHRNGHDKSEVEPVRDINMRLFALPQRDEKDEQIRNPHDCEEEICIPFGFGIFLRLRNAEQIARARNQDEEIIAQHHEPRRNIASKARMAGALHDIERGRDQHIAPERENHRRGVQRTHPAEIGPRQIKVQCRISELERNNEPHRETGNPPEHSRERGKLHRTHIVIGLAINLLRHGRCITREIAVKHRKNRRNASSSEQISMERIFRRPSLCGHDDRENRQSEESDNRTAFPDCQCFGDRRLLRHEAPPCGSACLVKSADSGAETTRNWAAANFGQIRKEKCVCSAAKTLISINISSGKGQIHEPMVARTGPRTACRLSLA